MDLSLSDPPAGGYVCWNPPQCGLCSHFLNPESVHRLFTDTFIHIGSVLDLFRYSRAGEKCSLCTYLLLGFMSELDGEPPVMDAAVSLHWGMEREDGSVPQIESFYVHFAWGWPGRRAKKIALNCFAHQGKSVFL